jgi:NADPH-dependent 2,4-dienoyl-CoA reductase/sulfur reductase-like enzyme
MLSLNLIRVQKNIYSKIVAFLSLLFDLILSLVKNIEMGRTELNIIVVGAGIASLAAAVALSRAGHNVAASRIPAT